MTSENEPRPRPHPHPWADRDWMSLPKVQPSPSLTPDDLLAAMEKARAELPEPGLRDLEVLRGDAAGSAVLAVRVSALEGTRAETAIAEEGFTLSPDLFDMLMRSTGGGNSAVRRWRTWQRILVFERAEFADATEELLANVAAALAGKAADDGA